MFSLLLSMISMSSVVSYRRIRVNSGFAPMSFSLLVVSLWLATTCIQSFGADLRPVSGADGIFETVRQNGKTAWRTVRNGSGDYNRYLYFMVPTPPHPGVARYLEINYKDVGNGALGVEYNSEGRQNYRPASRSCGQLMRGTGEIRTAVFELTEVDFRHAQNLGADFRLIGPEISSPLVILSVRLLDWPPPVLLEKNAQPWLEPYKGPSRSDVDASSLQGKVVCG